MTQDSAVSREYLRQTRYLLLMKLRRFDEAAAYAEADPADIAEIAEIRGVDFAMRLQAEAERDKAWVKRGLRIRRLLPFLR